MAGLSLEDAEEEVVCQLEAAVDQEGICWTIALLARFLLPVWCIFRQ